MEIIIQINSAYDHVWPPMALMAWASYMQIIVDQTYNS